MMSSKDKVPIWELTKNLELNATPTPSELDELIRLYGADLPADYLEFISKHDGANGDIGDNYLSIYTISDVLSVAEVFKAEPTSLFLLVASTGYFQYGIRASIFYELDMLEDDYQVALGTSFAEFLQRFSTRDWEND